MLRNLGRRVPTRFPREVFCARGVVPNDVSLKLTSKENSLKRQVTSIRIDEDTLRRLKRLAHRESLEGDQEVTWATMVRQAIERMLSKKEEK
jgi:hypothetical protein